MGHLAKYKRPSSEHRIDWRPVGFDTKLTSDCLYINNVMCGYQYGPHI